MATAGLGRGHDLLRLYYEVTHPLLDHYGERGILVSVDAMRPAELVGGQILTALEVIRQMLQAQPDAERTPIDLTGLPGPAGPEARST